MDWKKWNDDKRRIMIFTVKKEFARGNVKRQDKRVTPNTKLTAYISLYQSLSYSVFFSDLTYFYIASKSYVAKDNDVLFLMIGSRSKPELVYNNKDCCF